MKTYNFKVLFTGEPFEIPTNIFCEQVSDGVIISMHSDSVENAELGVKAMFRMKGIDPGRYQIHYVSDKAPAQVPTEKQWVVIAQGEIDGQHVTANMTTIAENIQTAILLANNRLIGERHTIEGESTAGEFNGSIELVCSAAALEFLRSIVIEDVKIAVEMERKAKADYTIANQSGGITDDPIISRDEIDEFVAGAD